MAHRIIRVPSVPIFETEYTTSFCPEGPSFLDSDILYDPDNSRAWEVALERALEQAAEPDAEPCQVRLLPA